MKRISFIILISFTSLISVNAQEEPSMVPPRVLAWLLEEEDRGDILERDNQVLDSTVNVLMQNLKDYLSIIDSYKQDSAKFRQKLSNKESEIKIKDEEISIHKDRVKKLKLFIIGENTLLLFLLLLL